MDRYSRKIAGWALSERIDTALVLGAWEMALPIGSRPQGWSSTPIAACNTPAANIALP